jgi:hypothetical protein
MHTSLLADERHAQLSEWSVDYDSDHMSQLSDFSCILELLEVE